jgi:AcrR family transcriptional regulator
MTPRRTETDLSVADSPVDGFAAASDAATRRAPFSDNPRVGVRGQRTQQRILDAALRVFGEEGYQNCSIDRIAKRAGCSRVSFYQYFSSREDVFRQLSGSVAHQLTASADALEPLTADHDGWDALRAWVSRYADIYDRYQPMFHTFQAASESDQQVATGADIWRDGMVARIRSNLASPSLPSRQIDPVIRLQQECLSRLLDIAAVLRTAVPAAYASVRIEDAYTDVVHRCFFGLRSDVNVHTPPRQRPPRVGFDPSMRELLQESDIDVNADGPGRKALAALLGSARDVFVRRGYHATRVDDLTKAAGVSHGAFYRYFKNKDELAQILVAEAIRNVSLAFLEIPDPIADGADAALRKWLRHYNATQSGESAMIRVWVDAALQDVSLRGDSAAAFDWGWRRMARYLQPRGFGDVDSEALVMVALLSAFGVRERTAAEIEATACIIERGLLGR